MTEREPGALEIGAFDEFPGLLKPGADLVGDFACFGGVHVDEDDAAHRRHLDVGGPPGSAVVSLVTAGADGSLDSDVTFSVASRSRSQRVVSSAGHVAAGVPHGHTGAPDGRVLDVPQREGVDAPGAPAGALALHCDAAGGDVAGVADLGEVGLVGAQRHRLGDPHRRTGSARRQVVHSGVGCFSPGCRRRVPGVQ